MHIGTYFFSGYNNGDYDMWRVGREQTIEARDHQTFWSSDWPNNRRQAIEGDHGQ